MISDCGPHALSRGRGERAFDIGVWNLESVIWDFAIADRILSLRF
jgi:hypothetical protein